MGYYTFPHTRTYDSDLGWLICQTKKLLEIYDKWDQLPDMIKEILEEYINSGEINDIIEEILGDFILNPKYPPSPDIPKASGDGSTDDTTSIQGCIDYAAEHGKLGVYFPTGAYLTGSLTLKDGVSLFGSDRYTTKLVLKSGATSPLLSGNVTNMGIHRLTLDSNAGNQVNNITTVSITAGTDIEFNDLIFASGYVNLSYLGTSGHLQLSNIIFANAVLKHLLIAGTADVQAENLMFENLSAVSGNCCMDISTDHGTYRFTSEAATPACIRCSGSENRFEGFIHNSVENVVDTGSNNDYIIYGQSQTETLSGDKKLTAANITEQISGDKTVTAGDMSETAENKTVHIIQDLTEQVDGNKTTNVTGANSIIANEIKLNPTEPLFYGTPQTFNDYYDYVSFNSITGNIYKVLVGKSASIDVVNIEKIGCVGDGITDNTKKLQNIINNNVGKIIFIPKGTFIISNTINLPSGSVIMGSGFNSVIKANNNNFDMCKTENFDNLTNTDTHDSAVGNWMLCNFMLDGNYYSDPEKEALSGRTSGRGLCIYGNNYYLINMIISNNPDTGLWIENNTYDNPAFNLLRAAEWTIDRCVIKFNGQHGLYSKSVFDFHLTNSVVASNSRKQHGTYDNLRIDGGNLKCTNCHFYSNYGTIKPKYSVNIMSNAGNCTFSNCHIEGAMIPLYIGAEQQTIDNCTIYASFGEYDCILAAGHNIITNCRFLYQVGDTSLEKPQWKSAIAFANNPRNCYIFAYCVNTPFIDDMTNCGYLNVFHIYGYNNTNIMENKACVIDTSKADYIIYGDFGEQSEYKEMSSVNNYTTIGSPDALQYDYFAGMNGNVTFNNNLCTITGYTSGTITIGEWATGRLKILINKTSSSIPYNTDGITIDGGTTGNILPNSVLILISNTENNYTSINLTTD